MAELVISALRGDPVSALWLDPCGCGVGTMTGRVSVFLLSSPIPTSEDEVGSPCLGHRSLIFAQDRQSDLGRKGESVPFHRSSYMIPGSSPDGKTLSPELLSPLSQNVFSSTRSNQLSDSHQLDQSTCDAIQPGASNHTHQFPSNQIHHRGCTREKDHTGATKIHHTGSSQIKPSPSTEIELTHSREQNGCVAPVASISGAENLDEDLNSPLETLFHSAPEHACAFLFSPEERGETGLRCEGGLNREDLPNRPNANPRHQAGQLQEGTSLVQILSHGSDNNLEEKISKKFVFSPQCGAEAPQGPTKNRKTKNEPQSEGTKFKAVFARLSTLKKTPHHKTTIFKGRQIVFASFSEDGITAIYLCGKEERLYVVVGCAMLCVWSLANLRSLSVSRLDRRLSANIRYILQEHSKVLISTSGLTESIDLVTEEAVHLPFRIPDRNFVVLDRQGSLIACISFQMSKAPCVKLLDFREPSSLSCSSDGIPLPIFEKEIPPTRAVACLIKIWGPDKLVIVEKGTRISVYDFVRNTKLREWKESEADILAMDTSNPTRLVYIKKNRKLVVSTVSEDGVARRVFKCTPAVFDCGWPCHIRSCGDVVAFSADSGVYLLDISATGGGAFSK